uniref:Thiol oxidase n=1 Tax=viral metagenome TaxID=1070528 RepID=A0A6C0KG91_9ZZZZ
MDPTIGFLTTGQHKSYMHKRLPKHDKVGYTHLWRRLHIAAARGKENLQRVLGEVREELSCPSCLHHYLSFIALDKNQRWLHEDPEFFAYKLHCAANAHARVSGNMASYPPSYSSVKQRYRDAVSSAPRDPPPEHPFSPR